MFSSPKAQVCEYVCAQVCVPHPQCKAINQKYVNNKTTKPKQHTRRHRHTHTHTAVTGKRGNFNYGHNGRPLGSSACRRHMPWTRDQNITEAACGAVLDPPHFPPSPRDRGSYGCAPIARDATFASQPNYINQSRVESKPAKFNGLLCKVVPASAKKNGNTKTKMEPTQLSTKSATTNRNETSNTT